MDLFITDLLQVQSVGPISPLDFYTTLVRPHLTSSLTSPHPSPSPQVKPVWNIEDKICLVSDPRQTNPFNKTYSVDCLGNMVGLASPDHHRASTWPPLTIT